jgi:hypothetical protein
MLAQYAFPITDTIEGFVRGDYRYHGREIASITDHTTKHAYSVVNFRVGANVGTWEAALFLDNATNSQPSFLGQPTAAGNLIGGLPIDETMRPFTIGLTAIKRF